MSFPENISEETFKKIHERILKGISTKTHEANPDRIFDVNPIENPDHPKKSPDFFSLSLFFFLRDTDTFNAASELQ